MERRQVLPKSMQIQTEAVGEREPRVASREGGAPSSDRIKVLLVEDNPGDARLIQFMLAEAGGEFFQVETAERLSTGLRRLAKGDIGLVLLDLSLPDSH